jgi:hypothetical protein
VGARGCAVTQLFRGDVVRTRSGLAYSVVSVFEAGRRGLPMEMASLRPLIPGPGRRNATAATSSLTLIRTAQLSLAGPYAAEADRAVEPWQRDRYLRWANHWFQQAQTRNDDTQDALHLLSDRLIDLEGEPCAS